MMGCVRRAGRRGVPEMRTTIVVTVVGLVVLAAACGRQEGSVMGPDERVTVEPGDAPARGPADAPVVLVEFGDFQCPYCGEMEPVVQRLLADYDGRICFVFKQFPLSYHSRAQLAAEASLAANAQGAFWPYHDTLYAKQDALARADLEAYAADLGLDLDAFGAALDDGTYAAAVAADVDQGKTLGVPGTPAFFINGRAAVGSVSYDTLKDVVDEELRLAGAR
jgi:protein-disulfide isomerase